MNKYILAGLLAAGLAGPAAAAPPSGAEILQKVDHGLTAFKDGVFVSRLYVKQPGGESREYDFTTYQKGADKRLVRFTAPGDVRGMGVLVENKDTMYVFLPGFQRVRRMGTHVKNQTFMGSDFSYEDMSQTTYSASYQAKLVRQEGSSYVLELTPRSGQDPEFPRLEMWVDNAIFQPTRIEYFDAAGKDDKTQLRSGYQKDAPDHYQPGKIVVTDHRRNHTSEIDFTSTKIDSGLADSVFSVRSLVRGQ